MHPEARAFVARHAEYVTRRPLEGLDVGGRDVNGSCRDLFPGVGWTVLDRLPGTGVDVVADVLRWEPGERRWDLVLCTEVLEHTLDWRQILYRLRRLCRRPGGLLLTCAGPGREPHSGIHGGPLEPGEYYRNLEACQLEVWLEQAGWRRIHVEENAAAHDLYARAVAC